MPNFSDYSSEEEIIHRKKIKKFEQESEENYEEEEIYDSIICPLFHEIFGTGHEYDYIYEEENQEEEEKEEITGDDLECYDYVKKQVPNVSQEAVELLFKGHSVEYVAFHCDKGTLVEMWEVEKLVHEYREFVSLRSKHKSMDVHKLDTLFALKMFKNKQIEFRVAGLLPMEKFVENILAQERLHEPEMTIPENFTSSPEYQKVVMQIARDPIFLDRIYRFYLRNIVSSFEHLSENELMPRIRQKIENEEIKNLQKFYLGDERDEQNEIRNKIVLDAFMQTDPSLFHQAKKELVENGQIPGINGLQELTNLFVSLKGHAGNYTGIFLDKKFVKMVKINPLGEILDKKILSSLEKEKIHDYIGTNTNVIVTANTANIKFLMTDTQNPIFYLPKNFSLFLDEADFSTPLNIASLIQNPLIYFSRALHENRPLMLNKQTVPPPLMRRALTATAAIQNAEWKQTLKNRHGYTLLKLLNISLAEKQYDFENISEMAQLEPAFTETDLEKVYTFFRLEHSKNILDTCNIHQKNYSVFRILADCIYNKNNMGSGSNGMGNNSNMGNMSNGMGNSGNGMSNNNNNYIGNNSNMGSNYMGSNNNNSNNTNHYSNTNSTNNSNNNNYHNSVSFMLNNLNLAANLNFKDISHPGFIHPIHALEMLVKSDQYFKGATDRMIFYDVVPAIINSNSGMGNGSNMGSSNSNMGYSSGSMGNYSSSNTVYSNTNNNSTTYSNTTYSTNNNPISPYSNSTTYSNPILNNTTTSTTLYSGVVVKIGNDFYLIDVQDAIVYVKKNCTLELNQLVDVQILSPSFSTLSYSGEIVHRKNNNLFLRHRLYRNISQAEMKRREIQLCIRSSSQPSTCVVVSRLDEDIFLSYRLQEVSGENVVYLLKRGCGTYEFDSLDDFIEGYLKDVNRFIHRISSFKYFKMSREEALDFVRSDSSKYSIFLSRDFPGCVEMFFGRSKLVVQIEQGFLMYKNNRFSTVEELCNYCKRNYPRL